MSTVSRKTITLNNKKKQQDDGRDFTLTMRLIIKGAGYLQYWTYRPLHIMCFFQHHLPCFLFLFPLKLSSTYQPPTTQQTATVNRSTSTTTQLSL